MKPEEPDRLLESRPRVLGPNGPIPLWIVQRADMTRAPPVLVLHGLGASANVQEKEVRSLARAGFRAIAVDAPHHGQRRDAYVDRMAEATPTESHAALLKLLCAAADELPAVLDAVTTSDEHVGVLGISMGAFTALTAAVDEPRLSAVVSILGSPDWTPVRGEVSEEISKLLPRAPVHRAEALAGRAVLFANAGRDLLVPPRAAREFAERLRALGSNAVRVRFLEYPESEHFMRESDWDALWVDAVAFLKVQLG